LYHLARGWAKKSIISASIHWIWLNYTYPDESCRVLVYCVEVHSMLGWCMYNRLWKCIWLLDKTIFGSSLPFCLLYVCLVWFFSFALSSTCWCEQMRGTPVTNREEMISLHSLPGLNFMFYLGFSLRLWPMYCFTL